MPELLIELFSEEIPARMQQKAAEDLRQMVTNALVEAGLTYEGAQAHGGARRIVLSVEGLDAKAADVNEERKGPRVDAPQPSVLVSSSVTATPRLASSRAAVTPAYPPPMTTTSALEGNGRLDRWGSAGIDACQKARRS